MELRCKKSFTFRIAWLELVRLIVGPHGALCLAQLIAAAFLVKAIIQLGLDDDGHVPPDGLIYQTSVDAGILGPRHFEAYALWLQTNARNGARSEGRLVLVPGDASEMTALRTADQRQFLAARHRLVAAVLLPWNRKKEQFYLLTVHEIQRI